MVRTLVIVSVIALALPQLARAQNAQAEKGRQVFAAQKCTMCHSIAGKGNPKGSLDAIGSKFTADEIRQWIVDWKAMAAKHNATRKPPMPDFSKLPKSEVDALVAYLQTLK